MMVAKSACETSIDCYETGPHGTAFHKAGNFTIYTAYGKWSCEFWSEDLRRGFLKLALSWASRCDWTSRWRRTLRHFLPRRHSVSIQSVSVHNMEAMLPFVIDAMKLDPRYPIFPFFYDSGRWIKADDKDWLAGYTAAFRAGDVFNWLPFQPACVLYVRELSFYASWMLKIFQIHWKMFSR